MSSIPTPRTMATRSISALQQMQRRARELQADWGDIDGTLVSEFGYLIDRLEVLAKEIAEVYPGRGKGGAA